MAQSDFYLKIDGIEGESEAVGFEKQIQVESWSFGATNSGSAGLGTGLGSGKVSMQDFHFVMQNGKASAQIMLAVCKGNHIPKAVLSCRKTGGDGTPYTYYTYTFDNLVLSSYQSGASQTLPMEQVSFNFTKITLEYFQQKPDGTVALTNTISYDTKRVEGAGA
ncbi:MAG: type VI secretion system tube protein Hcp [Acidobacteriota bacterium]|nr:type VI secretion system tube protein Hcp [Acidobacteriota bacterium]